MGSPREREVFGGLWSVGVDPERRTGMCLPMQHEPSSEVESEEPISVEESTENGVAESESAPEESEVEDRAAASPSPEESPALPPAPEEQIASWRERAIRATADLDNFRKRMTREKSESLRFANQALLEDLLPVLDNFEMGLQAAAGEPDSMIYRGMVMVKKQLDDFLKGNGVEEISAEGQVFDPNVHEAVSQEECPETEDGSILRVMRRGFRMNDRLLRPANVVVAKAPEEDAGAGTEEGGGE